MTAGIAEVKGTVEVDRGSMLTYKTRESRCSHEYAHGEGREWHRTKESAVAKAESMRLAKIASLKKQIAKLEKIKFE